MRYHVDVQIHSKYSRATSRNADIDHLALWARKKGITVVGTGDFTHPAWLAEIKDKLVPAEPGLFRLRPDLEAWVDEQAPAACSGPVRFMLEVEISTIYKKDGKVRKIHHLIFVPDMDAADRLVAALSKIGNLASDGRPILGLDSRDLLEITLQTGPHSYLIPAHIWTPWFAVLGSKSGFDSVDHCYGDLADHVFAVETGLSSDPPMNWRISGLDKYRLVSNSDAHSPPKIGREATTYDTALDYFAILEALKTGDGFVGTVEFFPEEGKYHMDGHRKCGIRFTPEETKAHAGRCPVCGGDLTVGVLHRIDALADRPADQVTPPPKAGEILSLVPLNEILAEIEGTGPSSKRVMHGYERLLAGLGSEMAILETVPVQDIDRVHSPLLGEAIRRLRAGQVIRDAGYDGEYGVIRMFEADELRQHKSGGLLFDLPASEKPAPPTPEPMAAREPREAVSDRPPQHREAEQPEQGGPLTGLDADQRTAAATVDGPLLIAAGPGSGKTRTLTRRIAHLVADRGVAPQQCLAITFTRRAAAEMRARLAGLLGDEADAVPVQTFHSLGLTILREQAGPAGVAPDFRIAGEEERATLLIDALEVSQRKAHALLTAISKAKRTGQPATEDDAEALASYQRLMAARGWLDFDDLVGRTVALLADQPALAEHYRARYGWISVDEFQDVDAQQYRLIRLLAPPGANLCVIGDANQAIYGFRGADAGCFARFTDDYPDARTVALRRNYRSSGTIVTAADQMIGSGSGGIAEVVREMADRITLHAAATERAEAEFVVHTIEQLIGGHSFFSLDSGRTDGGAKASDLSFADFAVLYRTSSQADALVEAFARSGMPFQRHGHAPLAENPQVKALLAAAEVLDAAGGTLDQRLAAATDRLAAEHPDEGAVLRAAHSTLIGLAHEAGGDATRFAEAVSLASEADGWDPRADRVSLMTLHASKGLEFPVVFVTGLEDGLMPLYWGARENADMAEERRLFYVGMTRAMDRLFLTHAAKRLKHGELQDRSPSPFLADIEAALTDLSRTKHRPGKDEDRQLALL